MKKDTRTGLFGGHVPSVVREGPTKVIFLKNPQKYLVKLHATLHDITDNYI
jgi:hypothetical protein